MGPICPVSCLSPRGQAYALHNERRGIAELTVAQVAEESWTVPQRRRRIQALLPGNTKRENALEGRP